MADGDATIGVAGAGDGPLDELTDVGPVVVCVVDVTSVGVDLVVELFT